MSGGVQGLRAMFEQSNSDISPPSRGRSPAGSVISDSSRPISKVRTSFVSVERSGQQGLPFAARKMSTGEGSVAGDNAEGNTSILNRPNGGTSMMNGTTVTRNFKDKNTEYGQEGLGGDGAQELDQSGAGQEESAAVNIQPTNPDKPMTGVEGEPSSMLPADPKDERAVSRGSALPPTQEDLGPVLKSSPFRKSLDQPAELAQASQDISLNGPSSSHEAKVDEHSKVNGQPKTAGSASKGAAAKSPTKTPTSRALAVDTKKTTSTTSKPQVSKSADKAGKSPRTPQTASSTSALARHSPSVSSPRQIAQPKVRSSNATRESEKKPTPPERKFSQASKPSTTAASRVRQTSSNTNTAPGKGSVQPSATTKPRARSPTRPVRLPSAVTATTQSSAAKHDELLSRSPSRASTAGTAKPPTSDSNRIRSSVSSNAGIPSRMRSTRASLPPQANTTQKPKPRTSTASTAASGESFLARMMRPTESSAKKTHEKLEVKSPPRKTGPPKRRSDGHKEVKKSEKTEDAGLEPTNPEQPIGTVTESTTQEPNIEVEDQTPRPSPDVESAEQPGIETDVDGTASEPVEPVQ